MMDGLYEQSDALAITPQRPLLVSVFAHYTDLSIDAKLDKPNVQNTILESYALEDRQTLPSLVHHG
jgi:hypothetical protein